MDNAKELKFDVVSIRPSGGSRQGGLKILPDGYEAIGMSLLDTLALAYAPAPYFKHFDDFKGAPSWVSSELYDFKAKVAPSDAAQWQSLTQNFMQTPTVLQGMLQQVLADRCKLRIHSTETTTTGYALRVGGKSTALVEDSQLPTGNQGSQLIDGARFVYSMQNGEHIYTFYNTSMPALAAFITAFSKGPVEDRTGLQGGYKFVLRRIAPSPSGTSTEPQIDMPVPWDLRAVGLKVESEKVKSMIWFIDNMERPTPN